MTAASVASLAFFFDSAGIKNNLNIVKHLTILQKIFENIRSDYLDENCLNPTLGIGFSGCISDPNGSAQAREVIVNVEWNRSETIALAGSTCTHCHGEGLRSTTRKSRQNPCNCVLRAIFRACYARFQYCALKEKQVSKVTWQFCGGKGGRRTWGRRDEEYMADFCLITRRTLDDFEHRIFRFHYLLGADWRLCCRQLNIDRGNFFHAVYRIQEKLGRVFRETQPYALFPLDEYFGGTIVKALPAGYEKVTVMKPRTILRSCLRPPVSKAA